VLEEEQPIAVLVLRCGRGECEIGIGIEILLPSSWIRDWKRMEKE
jgi:hypothetical protein